MSAGVRLVNRIEGTMRMIVIGTDTHKRTHTCGAVDAFTAAARGELTAPARKGQLRHAAALGASEAAGDLPKPLAGVQRPGWDLELGPEVVQMPAQPLLVGGAGGDQILAMVDQQANVERRAV